MKANRNKLYVGISTGIILLTTALITRAVAMQFTSSDKNTTSVASIRIVASANQDYSQLKQAVLDSLLKGTHNPTAKPQVTHVVVAGNYALATWLWGEGGGEAVLKKNQGIWQVVSSSGGAFTSEFLIDLGVPVDTAKALKRASY